MNFSKSILFITIFSILYSDVLTKSNNHLKSSEILNHPIFSEETSFYTYNNRTNKSDGITEEDIIAVINFSYPVYIILCLYMICAMNKYTDNPQVITNEIWKFMYLTNNGYIFISGGNTLFGKQDGFAYGFLIAGLAIFVIGTIIWLVKFAKNCCDNFMETFFSFNVIGKLYALPCTFVWSLLGVTDPCCMQTTYTVTTYADGHTESNECCVRFCNCTVYLLKRLAMLVSTIIYYIFIIVLTVIWLVLKGIITVILLLVVCCCGNKIAQAIDSDNTNVNQDINNQQQENLVEQPTNVPPPLEMNQNEITLNTNIEPGNENFVGGGDIYNNNNNIQVPYQYPDMNQNNNYNNNNYNYQPGMDRPPL